MRQKEMIAHHEMKYMRQSGKLYVTIASFAVCITPAHLFLFLGVIYIHSILCVHCYVYCCACKLSLACLKACSHTIHWNRQYGDGQ